MLRITTTPVQEISLDTPKSRSIAHILTSSMSGGNGSSNGGPQADTNVDNKHSVKRSLRLQKVIRKSIGGVKRAFRKLNCTRQPGVVPSDQVQFVDGLGSPLPSSFAKSDLISPAKKASFNKKTLPEPSIALSFATDSTDDTPPLLQLDIEEDEESKSISSLSPRLPLFESASRDVHKLHQYSESTIDLKWDFGNDVPPRSERYRTTDDGEDQPDAMRSDSNVAANGIPLYFDSGLVASKSNKSKNKNITNRFRKIRWEIVKIRLALWNRTDHSDRDGLFRPQGWDDLQQQTIDFSPLVVEAS